MIKRILYINIILSFLLFNQWANAQTASATTGCAELKVEFTAPQADSYYWVFGDGPASVSVLQNPVHSYVQAGSYTAQLFDVENGTQVGNDILITVYPPIEIDISADVQTGCAPLEVNFTSTINVHPDIEIADIVWTFGDGNSSSGQNTNYTYFENGVYTVSVKVITTSDIKCDEPVIFEDFIELAGEQTRFIANKYSACSLPATFVFTNITNIEPGSTFFWDFGNSETSTEAGPHTVTYNSEGLFYPELTITTPGGCETSLIRTISVGAPIITPTYPDTICIGVLTLLNQTTIADDFIWDFTGSDIDTSLFGLTTTEKRPNVIFTATGLQTFNLTAIAEDSCETTVQLDVFVSDADASYTLGPDNSCADPLLIEYTADDQNAAIYTFNNDILGDGIDITRTSPTGANIYIHPEHDEYYINILDSVSTRLIITSQYGCVDTAFNKYYVQKPEAFFIPDVVKGCVPFDVNFSDLSFSDFPIVVREWDFGDGGSGIFLNEDTLITHTYTTPGIHEVQLSIIDSTGCTDVSRKVQIVAIAKDTIPVPGIPFICPDISICVGDSITVGVSTNQVTANIHIESDEGRFDHCWRDVTGTHTYQYPGVYELNGTFEFYDIFIDTIITGCFITVEGSRSDIEYFIDCDNPYVVNFDGEKSINANDYAWYLEDQLISTDMAFDYTFDARGDYTVYLDTRQNGVGCLHRDSVLIHITDIVADINIPEKSCVTNPTPLDASGSQDVHNDCHAGFIWQFEDQRPREVNDSILPHFLLPGLQTVTLIVEDINGCTDTTTASTTAYDLAANFVADSLICLPSDVQMVNLSSSDTSIVNWTWNFGAGTSDLESPIHEFTIADYDTTFAGDSITVTLLIEDAIGCTDTTDFLITTYDIVSSLSMDNGPVICENDIIGFDATDYTVDGSFLTYEWDFGVFGTSIEDDPSVLFTEPGEHPVMLTFTEDATGCQGTLDTFVTVTPTPQASFISDQDDAEFICFPEQLIFSNTSVVEGYALYEWDFGNEATSIIENPVIPFDKGTYVVQLIVTTLEGCVDSFSNTYTLVGPEGNFTIDKDRICPGESITLTLENVVDVSTYTWDFGDGVQVDDQSPVTHTYNNQSSVTTFTPTLILRSDENGCELIQDIPIDVSSITADFEVTTGQCPGELSFSSNFENPQSIVWNIDGQIIEGTSTPSVAITSNAPTIDVILNVTDFAGCEIERRKTVDNPDLESSTIKFPNVFSPNGDAINQNFNIVFDDSTIDGEAQVTTFRVYDRWGELLYNNENPTVGWDGSFKGEIVPPDIYAYYIEVSIPGCVSRSKKGNVTVIK